VRLLQHNTSFTTAADESQPASEGSYLSESEWQALQLKGPLVLLLQDKCVADIGNNAGRHHPENRLASTTPASARDTSEVQQHPYQITKHTFHGSDQY
jgi:hypothetical protein